MDPFQILPVYEGLRRRSEKAAGSRTIENRFEGLLAKDPGLGKKINDPRCPARGNREHDTVISTGLYEMWII
jgi:hypothetical protein